MMHNPDKIRAWHTASPYQRNRRSIRLQGYDYSRTGAYFVTICTQNRQCLFGKIVNDNMQFTTMGRIAAVQWNAIPQRFADVQLDEFVIMPNHIHGIIVIVGAPLAGALAHTKNPIGAQNPAGATARVAPTIDIPNLTGTTAGAVPTIHTQNPTGNPFRRNPYFETEKPVEDII